MKLKDAEYESCGHCNARGKMISDEVFGCDECQSPTDDEVLRLTIFHHGDKDVEDRHFCGWKCCLKSLPSITTDYFVDLPYLKFDSDGPQSVQAFWTAIEEMRGEK